MATAILVEDPSDVHPAELAEFERQDRHIASIVLFDIGASGLQHSLAAGLALIRETDHVATMRAMQLERAKQNGNRLSRQDQQNFQREYGKRARILEGLGFDSYADYLASDLWKSIRGRVLARSRQCRVCRRRASHVHHERYTRAVLLGETLQFLVPLCGRCHHDIEFRSSDHVKLSPEQVRGKLSMRIGQHERRFAREERRKKRKRIKRRKH